ncbi:MAG: hypothetical protein AAGB34_07760 [Planctomycetota bacterium]
MPLARMTALTATAILFSTSASAQFLALNGRGAGPNSFPPEAQFIAPDGSSTQVFQPFLLPGLSQPPFGDDDPNTFVEANLRALAADDENRRFYSTDLLIFGISALPNNNTPLFANRVFIFSYDDLDNPVTHPQVPRIAEFPAGGAEEQGNFITVTGLAYDTKRKLLYATALLEPKCGPLGHADGIYAIDPQTMLATVLVDYADLPGSITVPSCSDSNPAAFINFDMQSASAIDYDPLTDRIYLANETPPDEGVECVVCRSIFAINPDNPTGFSTDPDNPAGVTRLDGLPGDAFVDVDGLAAGNGQLLLVTDTTDTNFGVHAIYDIAARDYVSFPATAFPPLGTIPGFNSPALVGSGGAYTPNFFTPQPVVGCDAADTALPTAIHDFFDVARYLERAAAFDPLADFDDNFEVLPSDYDLFFADFGDGCPVP